MGTQPNLRNYIVISASTFFYFKLEEKRMNLSWRTSMLFLALWMVAMATMCEAAPSDYSNYPNNIVCWSYDVKCPPGADCIYVYIMPITRKKKGYCAFSSPRLEYEN